jgi:hypothetical protein
MRNQALFFLLFPAASAARVQRPRRIPDLIAMDSMFREYCNATLGRADGQPWASPSVCKLPNQTAAIPGTLVPFVTVFEAKAKSSTRKVYSRGDGSFGWHLDPSLALSVCCLQWSRHRHRLPGGMRALSCLRQMHHTRVSQRLSMSRSSRSLPGSSPGLEPARYRELASRQIAGHNAALGLV